MAEKRLRIKKIRPDDWQVIEIGPTARVYSKPVDKAVLKDMPVSTRTFLDMGIWDLLSMKLKNVFSPSSNIDSKID